MGEASGPRTLGKAIRERRIELGWSQEELAARASARGREVRQSDVSRLERDKVGLPRRERLEQIAAVLGLPLGELLVRSGWAGADTALEQAERPPQSAAPPASPAPARPTTFQPGAPPDPDAPPRLRSAIDRAHELEAWSADLLRRSASSFDRVNQSASRLTPPSANVEEPA